MLPLHLAGTQSSSETDATPTFRWACDGVLTYKALKLTSAAYSPDGTLLAVGTETGALALFSVEQPQLVRVLLHPGGQVRKVVHEVEVEGLSLPKGCCYYPYSDVALHLGCPSSGLFFQ
jgi:hypothetical protein